LFDISADVPGAAAYGADVGVLAAGGEIDYMATPLLRQRLLDHIEAGKRHLVLDLSTATFVDSTAIGVLVGAFMSLQQAGGGTLRVVCTEDNERVLRIFDIVGLASLMVLHRSHEQAQSALEATRLLAVPAWAGAQRAAASGGVRPPRRPARPRPPSVRGYAHEGAAPGDARHDAGACTGDASQVDELA
jgi:anti-sigma B factor antagonist